jgi:cytochrome bd-type quinol oxidase subunit 2
MIHDRVAVGLFVFPLMLLYTAISLTVFRGQITPSAGYH